MNRMIGITGTVLLAVAMSGAVSSDVWAQSGKGNGRGSRDTDSRPSQSRQADADRQRDRELSKEDRDQLRRDIRDHGRDVYRDRDSGRGSNGDRRPRRTDRSSR